MPENFEKKQKDPNISDKNKNMPKVVLKEDVDKNITFGPGGNETKSELPGNHQNEHDISNVPLPRIDPPDVPKQEIDPLEILQVRKTPPGIDRPEKDIPELNWPGERIKEDPYIDQEQLVPHERLPPDKPQNQWKPPVPGLEPWSSFTISLLRPRDLLLLDFTFINFILQKEKQGTTAILHRKKNAPFAYIIVEFPQQSILEEAFFETDANLVFEAPPEQEEDDNLPTDRPAQNRISGKSRLVFEQPQIADPIPCTIEELLKVLGEYPLIVTATAQPDEVNSDGRSWPSIPGLISIIGSRYGHYQGGDFNPLKKHSDLGKRSKQKVNWTGKKSEKSFPIEDQYALNKKVMVDTCARLRAERSKLLKGLESISDVLSTAAGANIGTVTNPQLSAPSELETSIEAPFRLILSPNRYAAWAHALNEVVAARKMIENDVDWVELWHTRLGIQLNDTIDENPNPLRTVRAIWAKDACFNETVNESSPGHYGSEPPCPDNLFRASLDANNRFNIVHLSANFRLQNEDTRINYQPKAITVERMMLSSLGSWLQLRGVWDQTPKSLSLEEWQHRSTMARDHYVRVVEKGYLFPFGHQASLIVVTERRFNNEVNGNPAYLRQRMFIVVREPERIYPQTNITQYDLAFPFTRVQITTLVTPLLAGPDDSDIAGGGRRLFRPRVGSTGKDFQFQVIGEDLEGREVEFSLPMIFVSDSFKDNFDKLTEVQAEFTGTNPQPADLNSQAVCFAPSEVQGDTILNAEKIWFGAQVPDVANYGDLKKLYSTSDTPMFYPRIEKASARIPAIQHLVGNNGVATFSYLEAFLQYGFNEENEGQVFAEFIDTLLELNFSSQGQRSGALVTPNIKIAGLSRLYGPVGGQSNELADITNDIFNPEAYFAGMSPYLFGVIKLVDLIRSGSKPPEIITTTMTTLLMLYQNMQRVKYLLEKLDGLEDELQNTIDAFMGSLDRAIGFMAEMLDNLNSFEDLVESIDRLVINLIREINNLNTYFETIINGLNTLSISASVRIPIEDALTSLITSLNGFKGKLESIKDKVGYLKQINQLITDQKVILNWKTELQDWPAEHPIFSGMSPSQPPELTLHVEVDGKSSQKGAPAFRTYCGLHTFKLNLIGEDRFIILTFGKIEFSYASGKKADVNVEFEGIEFVGVLSFVEVIRTLIPLDGFSDPPGLEITAAGITSSYSLALPELAFGVFNLSNMSLSAGFSIPFIGDPLSVWFGFCTRENPFTLTVSMFGGGGFFAVTLNPDGLRCLEAAFEFGASVSVDFGVASGGVQAMAGIYYKMEWFNGDLVAQLAGYFRMGGNLSVLGLITASIEIYMALYYESTTGKCAGVAELTIEVEVLFFSASVKLRAERKFSGSNGDPTFAELMAPYQDPMDSSSMVNPWEKYCLAFA